MPVRPAQWWPRRKGEPRLRCRDDGEPCRHHGLAGAMVADLHAVAILDRPDLYATRPARIAVDAFGRCREEAAAPVLDLVVAVRAEAVFAHLAARLARLSRT